MVLQPDLPCSIFVHGFFQRHHGISRPPFDSLNISFSVGDDQDCVRRNRAHVKERLQIGCLVSAVQVHGTDIAVLTERPGTDLELDGYDGLITDQLDVGLLIQQADCQAILLVDTVRPAIGALHCGWRGSVANVIESGISAMEDAFGSEPAGMMAAISPSLGPCCAEFVHHQFELPQSFQTYQVTRNHFDFWRISTRQLIRCGLKQRAVSVAGVCTCCNSDYFSYRRAIRAGQATTGRNCSVIALQE